jgi:hypothetical protein
MKTALTFSLGTILLLFAMVALGQAPVPKQPFTIILSADKTTAKAGSPVLVTLQLTNNSDHDMAPGWWGQNSLGVIELADAFDVRDGRGHPLAKRKPDPKSDFIIGNGVAATIYSGRTGIYTQDFGRWYDLSQPGQYTIQASRPFSENGKKGVVTSNKLTIIVTK